MLTASSMRYGGMLVEASECNYTSFKHLGLLCPICKKSVFLVSGSNREAHSRKLKSGQIAQVKEAKIPAHFAHHADTSPDSVAICELRSAQITEAQKIAIAAKAKGQRLKTLQAHCWKILLTSVKLGKVDSAEGSLERIWLYALGAVSPSKKAVKKLLSGVLDSVYYSFTHPVNVNQTKSTLGSGLRIWVKQSKDSDLIPEDLQGTLLLWGEGLDLKMQELIMCEVLDFLCQPRQRPMLESLIKQAVWNFIWSQAIWAQSGGKSAYKSMNRLLPADGTIDKELMQHMAQAVCVIIQCDEGNTRKLLEFVRDDILQSMALVDWAGQFEHLEIVEKSRTLVQ